MALTPDERGELDAAIHRQVLALWQTAMLRLSQLRVIDEIDNGLDLLPRRRSCRGAAALSRARGAASRAARPAARGRRGAVVPAHGHRGSAAIATAIRYVTADDAGLRDRARRAASPSRITSSEVHALGGELSLSTRLVHAERRSCFALAAARTTTNPHRQDEPYRQALSASTHAWPRPRASSRATSPRVRPTRTCPPMRRPSRARRRPRDDRRVARRARRGAARRRTGLRRRCFARSRRSAFTWPRSTCGRTPTSTRRWSPSCCASPASKSTTPRSPEDARVALLLRELATPRPLHSPHRDLRRAHARRARDPRGRRRRSTGASGARRSRTT